MLWECQKVYKMIILLHTFINNIYFSCLKLLLMFGYTNNLNFSHHSVQISNMVLIYTSTMTSGYCSTSLHKLDVHSNILFCEISICMSSYKIGLLVLIDINYLYVLGHICVVHFLSFLLIWLRSLEEQFWEKFLHKSLIFIHLL